MKMHTVVIETVGRNVLWARTPHEELVMIPRHYANGALEHAALGDKILCALVPFNRPQKPGLPEVKFFGKYPAITSAAQNEPNPCAWKKKHEQQASANAFREVFTRAANTGLATSSAAD